MSRHAEPDEIEGSFVVEIGERQVWPFITFCDNRGGPPREVRLHLDTDYSVEPHEQGARSSRDPTILRLLTLNNLTVERAQVGTGGVLEISFAGGDHLTVSGTATADTVGEPWWFSPWAS